MHPFDPRTVLLARHAQHVVLVHFPIALFITAVAFDFIGAAAHRDQLSRAAYWNFSVAALTTLPVMMTGILAWRFALEGQRVKGVLLMHMIFGGLSSVFICLVWFVHRQRQKKPGGSLPRYRFAIEIVGVALVAITGHLGGFLSGVNAP